MAEEKWGELIREAQKKGIDINQYILEGVPYETLKSYVEKIPTKRGVLGEFTAGMGRAALAVGEGVAGLGEMLRIPGAEKAAEFFEEKKKALAPAPDIGLAAKVAGYVGEAIPMLAGAFLAPEVAIPAFGLEAAGEIYHEQPGEKKSALRALGAGAVVGAAGAIPYGKIAGKAGIRAVSRAATKKPFEALAKAAATAERKVPLKVQKNIAYRLARQAGEKVVSEGVAGAAAREAASLPLTFYGMNLAYEYGLTGQASPRDLAAFFINTPEGRRELLAQAILGAFFGAGGEGVERRLGKKPLEKEIPTEKPRKKIPYDRKLVEEKIREKIYKMSDEEIERYLTEIASKRREKIVSDLEKSLREFIKFDNLPPVERDAVKKILKEYATALEKTVSGIEAERELPTLARRREEVARAAERIEPERIVEEAVKEVEAQEPPKPLDKEFLRAMKKLEEGKVEGEGILIPTEFGLLPPGEAEKRRVLLEAQQALAKPPFERTAEDLLAIRKANELGLEPQVLTPKQEPPRENVSLIIPEEADKPYRKIRDVLPEEERRRIIETFDKIADRRRREVVVDTGRKRIRLVKKARPEEVQAVKATAPEPVVVESILSKFANPIEEGKRKFRVELPEGEREVAKMAAEWAMNSFYNIGKRTLFPEWAKKRGWTLKDIERSVNKFKEDQPLTKKEWSIVKTLLENAPWDKIRAYEGRPVVGERIVGAPEEIAPREITLDHVAREIAGETPDAVRRRTAEMIYEVASQSPFSPTAAVQKLLQILPPRIAKTLHAYARNPEKSRIGEIIKRITSEDPTDEAVRAELINELEGELRRWSDKIFTATDYENLHQLARENPIRVLEGLERLRERYTGIKTDPEVYRGIMEDIQRAVDEANEAVRRMLEENPAFDFGIADIVERKPVEWTTVGPFVAVKVPLLKIKHGVPLEERTDYNFLRRYLENLDMENPVDAATAEDVRLAMMDLEKFPSMSIDFDEAVFVFDPQGKIADKETLKKALLNELRAVNPGVKFNKSVEKLLDNIRVIGPEEYILFPRDADTGRVDLATYLKNTVKAAQFEAAKPRIVLLEEKIPPAMKPEDVEALLYHEAKKRFADLVRLEVLKKDAPTAQMIIQMFGPRVAGLTAIVRDRPTVAVLLNDHTNPIKTLFHELFHVAAHHFTPEEVRVFERKWGKNWEETAAEEFAKYLWQKDYQPEPWYRKVFNVLKDYYERLTNALRGIGFESTYGVFDRIDRGDFIARIREERKWPGRQNISEHYRDLALRDIVSLLPDEEVKVALREADQEAFVLPSQEELKETMKPGRFVDTAKFFLADMVSAAKIAFGKKYPFWYNFITPSFVAKKNEAVAAVYRLLERSAVKANEIVMEGYEPVYARYKSLSEVQAKAFNKIAYWAGVKQRVLSLEEMRAIARREGFKLSERELQEIESVFRAYKKFGDYLFVEQSKAIFTRILASHKRDVSDMNFARRIAADYRLLDRFRQEFKDLPPEEAADRAFFKAVDYLKGINDELGVIIEKFFVHEDRLWGDTDPRAEALGKLKKLREKIAAEAPELLEYYDNIFSLFDRYENYWENLRNFFYAPRVREGGRYEVRVMKKVDKETYAKYMGLDPATLPDDRPYYILAGYYTTKKRLSDSAEQVEKQRIVEALKRKLGEDVLVTENTVERREVYSSGKEWIVLHGRIPEKETLSLTRAMELSPTELFEVIHHLLSQTPENPEIEREVSKYLKTAADRLVAQFSYAKARQLSRTILPTDIPAIMGFSEDVVGTFNRHVINMANFIANSYFLADYIPLRTHSAFKQVIDPETVQFLNRWVSMVTAPLNETARFVYKTRALAAFYFLAFRVSSAAINLSSIMTTAIPELSAYVEAVKGEAGLIPKRRRVPHHKNVVKAAGAWKKAVADIVDFWRKPGTQKLSPEEKAMLDTLRKEGIVAPMFLNTIRMEALGAFGRNLQSFMDMGMIPFQFTEEKMREAGALAAYRIFRERGLNHEEAINQVRQYIRDAFFDYTRINRYWWTNPGNTLGAILNIPTTLGGFMFNYLSWLITGLHETGGGIYLDKALLSFAAFAALGGAFSMPFVGDMLDAAEKLSKLMGHPVIVRKKIENVMRDQLGDGITKALLYGLPHAAGIVDFGAALRVELPVPKSLTPDDLFNWFFGVHATEFKRLSKAWERYRYGDYWGALAAVVPSMALSNALEALKLYEVGMETRGGTPIRDLEGRIFKLTAPEAALKALGFRPARLAEMQDLLYTSKKLSAILKEERSELLARWLRARTPEERNEVMKEITEFNQRIARFKGIVRPITAESLRRKQKIDPNRMIRTVPLI